MSVSIIIPAVNEAKNLPRLLRRLQDKRASGIAEVILVDGGSTDGTQEIARGAGCLVLQSERCCRAAQMNMGAAHATGAVLQFVHADTLPPIENCRYVRQAIEEGYEIGSYAFRFDSHNPLLRINSWFTRLDKLWCRGGDQAIFITRRLFDELQGYRDMAIMEEYDLILRARQRYAFKIIKTPPVTVSARKYAKNGYLRVQIANLVVFQMFKRGYPPERLARTYKRLLN